jgi:hypothetical protein
LDPFCGVAQSISPGWCSCRNNIWRGGPRWRSWNGSLFAWGSSSLSPPRLRNLPWGASYLWSGWSRAAWVSIDPCGRRLLRELSSFRSHSSSCELVIVVVLCMTTLGVWEHPRSGDMKSFFRAAWGKVWQMSTLLLWTWCSSPPTPYFKRRLWTRATNFILLFMFEIDSRAFKCKCFLFCMLMRLELVGMWARMVHLIPPLLDSSCQLHSKQN